MRERLILAERNPVWFLQAWLLQKRALRWRTLQIGEYGQTGEYGLPKPGPATALARHSGSGATLP
jgi:hypothetical protein